MSRRGSGAPGPQTRCSRAAQPQHCPMREDTTVARWRERDALPGEVCTCGLPAVVVLVDRDRDASGWCGLTECPGVGPCPFCGGPRHGFGRCPDYVLRPNWARPPSRSPNEPG